MCRESRGFASGVETRETHQSKSAQGHKKIPPGSAPRLTQNGERRRDAAESRGSDSGSGRRRCRPTQRVTSRTAMLRVLLPIAALLRAVHVHAIQPGVVPQPQSITYSGANVTLSSQFSFTAIGQESAILTAAFARYGKLLGGGGGLVDGPTGSATVSA